MDTKPPYAGQTRSESFLYDMQQASDAYKDVYGVRPTHLYAKWRDWMSDGDMYLIRYNLGAAASFLVAYERLLPQEAINAE